MSECRMEEIRDMLPEFAAERLGGLERSRVARHVAGCAECMAEVDLLVKSRRALARSVPVVDTAAIVAKLPKPPVGRVTTAGVSPRLAVADGGLAGKKGAIAAGGHAQAPRPRRASYSGGWRIAAAVTLVAGGLTVAVLRRIGGGSVDDRPDAVAGVASGNSSGAATSPNSAAGTEMPGSQSTAQGASGGVTAGSVAAITDGAVPVGGDISELSDGDVESLVQDIAALDAEPSIEPEAAAPALHTLVNP